MGVHFDRLRYEVFQNLFLSPMNTGSVRPAVATTPTACGMRRIDGVSEDGNLYTRCNNTYRLRYAPKGARQQRSKATMRSAHLKYLNEEKVKQR